MAWNFSGTSSDRFIDVGYKPGISDFPNGDWAIGGLFFKVDNDFHDLYNIDFDGNALLATGIANSANFTGTFVDDNGNSVTIGGTSLPNGWNHLLFQRKGDDIEIYSNGSLSLSFNEPGLIGATGLPRINNFGMQESWRALAGRLAEWAKWDRSFELQEIQKLAQFHSPTNFRRELKWYFSMIRDFREEWAGLSVTNDIVTVVEHPPIIYPKPPIVIPIKSPPFIDETGLPSDVVLEARIGTERELIIARRAGARI